MKKSLICLGIAIMTFGNVAIAGTAVGHYETAEMFIARGGTPLCTAISKGDVDVVRKFIEYGANVNEKSNGMTPLMVAARYNNVEIIQLLLDNGADLYARNENKFTALKFAELSNASEAITYLSSRMK